MLNNKYLQAALTVVGVIIVLKLLSPYTSKIPVVGNYLTLS